MTRQGFIQSLHATCRNWRWSWAFVQHDNRWVIFGAWDVLTNKEYSVILDEDWERSPNTGRKQPGYSEALEYVGLVKNEGYFLKTFPMGRIAADPRNSPGIARIANFRPILSDCTLKKKNRQWLAIPLN